VSVAHADMFLVEFRQKNSALDWFIGFRAGRRRRSVMSEGLWSQSPNWAFFISISWATKVWW